MVLQIICAYDNLFIERLKMPQDNTQIDSDNNQAVPQVPPSNDAVNPVYASVPVEPVVPVDNPVPVAIPAEPPVSDVVVTPGPEPAEPEAAMSNPVSTDIRSNIATKIGENKNVLIALSSDPSVDELAAAIGLSLYLDRIGKRATAIYSGATPNTLEFLKPEETFEPSADTLQDFVIAINIFYYFFVFCSGKNLTSCMGEIFRAVKIFHNT